jgi:hypothetical protein
MILHDENAFPEGKELQVLYLSRDAPIFRSALKSTEESYKQPELFSAFAGLFLSSKSFHKRSGWWGISCPAISGGSRA